MEIQLYIAPAFVANARPDFAAGYHPAVKEDTHSCSAEQGNQVQVLNTVP
jgi:hypothetical protein